MQPREEEIECETDTVIRCRRHRLKIEKRLITDGEEIKKR